MKTLKFIIISFFLFLNFALVTNVNATIADGCNKVGQCINNQKCVCNIPDSSGNACRVVSNITLSDLPCGAAVIGGVEPPTAISSINESANGIGIIYFVSRIFRFLTVIAGVWVMFNFIQAGYTYITSNGNAQAHQTVRDQLTWSIVGLLIIAVAYTAAGVFGLIFFGEAGFILNPTIQGAIN